MKVSLLAVLALAAVAHAGICPKYPIIRDFDFHRYMGLWYQQDKRQASWEAPGRCWKTLYSRDRKNGQFKMKMIFKSTITDRVEEYDSQLTLQGPSKPSLIKYTIPLTFMEDEFQVLATDYESFSLEYKCDPNGLLEKSESIWLLTREKNPSPLVLQRAYAILHHLGIDIRKLERVDQTCGGIDIVNIPTYTDYDYYNANLQVTDNRRYQQQQNTQGVEYFQYDDYFPQDDYHANSNPTQQSDPSTHFAVSYPPQPTDSNVRRVQQQPHRYYSPSFRSPYDTEFFSPNAASSSGYHWADKRKQFHLKHQTIPTDERITLGQSLATRLWHVLHTPVSK